MGLSAENVPKAYHIQTLAYNRAVLALSRAVWNFSPAMYRILAAETLRREIVAGFAQDGVATSAKWYRWLKQQ